MSDVSISFSAYRNYLLAIQIVITKLFPDMESLTTCIADSKGFRKITGKAKRDEIKIEKALRLSWYTELLMKGTSQYPDLMIYSNPWTLIQLYYSIYFMIRAYLFSCGQNPAETHYDTLKMISADIISHPKRFPRPWGVYYDGNPFEDETIFLITNSIISDEVKLKSPLFVPKNLQEGMEHYGLFLKTTREKILEKKIERWKRFNKAKQIPREFRRRFAREERLTTIFDIFSRIRTRFNYQDVELFMLADPGDFQPIEFHENACCIVAHTNLLFEMLIAMHTGKKWFSLKVNDFSLSDGLGLSKDTIQMRWDAMRKSW